MNGPLITVIIPVYNNTKYLPSAVSSVQKQDFSNWEMIIVDDGSTDGTGELADELAVKDGRIHVIHQDNQWIYASMNNGIAAATGEYVYILNSDDKLSDNAFLTLKKALAKYNYPDVIWTKVIQCFCDERQTITKQVDVNSIILEEEYWTVENDSVDSWNHLIQSNMMNNQANLYKSELAKKTVFRNDIYGADSLYNISIARRMTSFAILPEPIYLFHQYSNQSNTSVGKYYGYEHEMFNDFYTESMALIEDCNKKTESNLVFLKKRRMTNYSFEIGMLLQSNLSEEEKYRRIFEELIDDIVDKYFKEEDKEQLEARILRRLRDYYIKHIPNEYDEYYFAYKMLEALLRYEKDEEDFKFIIDGVNNVKNPHRIGEVFLRKICNDY